VRIDLQVSTHLDEKIVADFLLPILESGEFRSEIYPAMAPLSLIRDEMAG